MAPTKLPIIYLVDDDAQVLSALRSDVRAKFRSEYRILSTTNPEEVLASLKELVLRGETVALFISDQRMPVLQGVDLLEQTKEYFPDAKRMLLTAYSDTGTAIRAINEVDLDYYLMKPWDPPEQSLYPVVEELLDEWQSSHRGSQPSLRVIGYQFSPRSHQIREFLASNLIPYRWMDYQNETEAADLLKLSNIEPTSLPALIFDDGTSAIDLSMQALAQKLGLHATASSNTYDVVIIGAGPAGLAAAVYAGSEGLKALVVEKHAPGGQAGTSSRIENYLGFPKGVSGAELTRRAMSQATKFHVECLSPQEVTCMQVDGQYKKIQLANGTTVNTRTVLITTGVSYRTLEVEGIEPLLGAGVYYGAATVEAPTYRGKEVCVLGGGNSAGQAALFLARFASHVSIIIRKSDLTSTMSSYLIDQINMTPNISVIPDAEIARVSGGEHLEKITLKKQNGESQQVDTSALFIFIGAKPHTEWLQETVLRDDRGFVVTGRDLLLHEPFKKSWAE
ncbi:MAG TPA: FAD-dependent oxidoreductase, partial [Candidatus Kapabacteria bacterium]|nr:FAD-dependent oxidoreductase [Candidatus Kapabacteria bacterium]